MNWKMICLTLGRRSSCTPNIRVYSVICSLHRLWLTGRRQTVWPCFHSSFNWFKRDVDSHLLHKFQFLDENENMNWSWMAKFQFWESKSWEELIYSCAIFSLIFLTRAELILYLTIGSILFFERDFTCIWFILFCFHIFSASKVSFQDLFLN